MRGRTLFAYVSPMLVIFSWLLYLLPAFLVRNLWVWLDLVPGLLGVGLRYSFALRLAKSVGKNVFFGRGIEVLGWDNFSIGNNVSIHKDCYIDAKGGLSISNDVSIAHGVSILTFEHTWENPDLPIRSNSCVFQPVTIKSDVWIGCGSRILAGVTVESRAVVAAGAVVVKDVPSRVIVAGVPAKVIKKI